MPSGCSAFAVPPGGPWKRDEWGELHQRAGVSREACEEKRKRKYDNWCRTIDTKMVFVPGKGPPRPTVPGCYMWMPTGCPKQKFHAMTTWRHAPYDNKMVFVPGKGPPRP